MASLREIKDHIGSVRSTLKITSAMKLVASAKLRRAQQAITDLLPYEKELQKILSEVPSKTEVAFGKAGSTGKVVVVAVSSNSSLCGAFNANVLREVVALVKQFKVDGTPFEVIPVGRKVADSLKKSGVVSPVDYNPLVGHCSFDKSAALAQKLVDGIVGGEYSKVLLIYNHFVSTSSQKVLCETYLEAGKGLSAGTAEAQEQQNSNDEYIIEPDAQQIVDTLMPLVLNLKIHSVILDSQAAEHAARTVAMQTATDNAEKLVSELTLEYNKGRQDKITSELLDLAGGAAK